MIVKICGIKNEETLFCCEKNKVDFFGMIFYPKSPRNILIDEAKKLQFLSKNLRINGVGVFVDEELADITKIIKDLNLKFVQLHGRENNNYIKTLKKLKLNIIKKISIREKNDLEKVKNYKDADIFLFDYKPELDELPGGNAKKFDWNIVKNIKIDKPWFLSGGINLDNIETIKTEIKAFGIDLSSGVEKKLGIKDNQIINNFIGKLNNA
tara:strand:- start:858 stop:1487 length:630 start_codon:yes stop_codon:yes gene_type:complete